MRTVSLSVRNGQLVELFCARRGGLYDGFEVWIVGPVAKQRVVLSHFITSEHIERRLSYALPGDLVWRDSSPAEIPSAESDNAKQLKETISRGTFLEPDIFGLAAFLTVDRKVWNQAKKDILGTWTDGIATITFETNSKLTISCPPAAAHPLFSAAYDFEATWWNFASWRLFLMNDAEKTGNHAGVWRCDNEEFHLFSQWKGCLAHVFRRVTQSK